MSRQQEITVQRNYNAYVTCLRRSFSCRSCDLKFWFGRHRRVAYWRSTSKVSLSDATAVHRDNWLFLETSALVDEIVKPAKF